MYAPKTQKGMYMYQLLLAAMHKDENVKIDRPRSVSEKTANEMNALAVQIVASLEKHDMDNVRKQIQTMIDVAGKACAGMLDEELAALAFIIRDEKRKAEAARVAKAEAENSLQTENINLTMLPAVLYVKKIAYALATIDRHAAVLPSIKIPACITSESQRQLLVKSAVHIAFTQRQSNLEKALRTLGDATIGYDAVCKKFSRKVHRLAESEKENAKIFTVNKMVLDLHHIKLTSTAPVGATFDPEEQKKAYRKHLQLKLLGYFVRTYFPNPSAAVLVAIHQIRQCICTKVWHENFKEMDRIIDTFEAMLRSKCDYSKAQNDFEAKKLERYVAKYSQLIPSIPMQTGTEMQLLALPVYKPAETMLPAIYENTLPTCTKSVPCAKGTADNKVLQLIPIYKMAIALQIAGLAMQLLKAMQSCRLAIGLTAYASASTSTPKSNKPPLAEIEETLRAKEKVVIPSNATVYSMQLYPVPTDTMCAAEVEGREELEDWERYL